MKKIYNFFLDSW